MHRLVTGVSVSKKVCASSHGNGESCRVDQVGFCNVTSDSAIVITDSAIVISDSAIVITDSAIVITIYYTDSAIVITITLTRAPQSSDPKPTPLWFKPISPAGVPEFR